MEPSSELDRPGRAGVSTHTPPSQEGRPHDGGLWAGLCQARAEGWTAHREGKVQPWEARSDLSRGSSAHQWAGEEAQSFHSMGSPRWGLWAASLEAQAPPRTMLMCLGGAEVTAAKADLEDSKTHWGERPYMWARRADRRCRGPADSWAGKRRLRGRRGTRGQTLGCSLPP